MKVITIGRLEDNDMVVNDACASRHHLQIIQHDDGHYSLADFGSTNGTFINGQKISGEVELNMNDVVRIGNSTIPWRLYFEKNEQETTQFNNVSPEFDEVPQHDDASQHKDTDTLTSNPTMPLKKEPQKKKVGLVVSCIIALFMGFRFSYKSLFLINVGEEFMLPGVIMLICGLVLIVLSIVFMVRTFRK